MTSTHKLLTSSANQSAFICCRHIPQAAASMKEGKWDRKKVCHFENCTSCTITVVTMYVWY